MITVLASISIKNGYKDAFIDIFKENMPSVLLEDGCMEYYPTIDVNSGLTAQQLEPQTITIVEKWKDLDALKAHLKAPHMIRYQGKVSEMVSSVSLKILQAA